MKLEGCGVSCSPTPEENVVGLFTPQNFPKKILRLIAKNTHPPTHTHIMGHTQKQNT